MSWAGMDTAGGAGLPRVPLAGLPCLHSSPGPGTGILHSKLWLRVCSRPRNEWSCYI